MKTQNEVKHTPGPWFTDGIDGLSIHQRTGERTYRFIALTDSEHDTGRTDDAARAEDMANARLIAAAPELLEAARDAYALLEANGWRSPQVKLHGILRAAIAKAEGRVD